MEGRAVERVPVEVVATDDRDVGVRGDPAAELIEAVVVDTRATVRVGRNRLPEVAVPGGRDHEWRVRIQRDAPRARAAEPEMVLQARVDHRAVVGLDVAGAVGLPGARVSLDRVPVVADQLATEVVVRIRHVAGPPGRIADVPVERDQRPVVVAVLVLGPTGDAPDAGCPCIAERHVGSVEPGNNAYRARPLVVVLVVNAMARREHVAPPDESAGAVSRRPSSLPGGARVELDRSALRPRRRVGGVGQGRGHRHGVVATGALGRLEGDALERQPAVRRRRHVRGFRRRSRRSMRGGIGVRDLPRRHVISHSAAAPVRTQGRARPVHRHIDGPGVEVLGLELCARVVAP